MAIEFKKLSDVNVIEAVSETANVLVEENGEIVKTNSNNFKAGLLKTDETLTVSGKAADAAVTGAAINQLSEEIENKQPAGDYVLSETVVKDLSEKVTLPTTNGAPNYGTVGQFAISDGNGGIAWKTLHEVQEVSY